jgi:hypothetical protein
MLLKYILILIQAISKKLDLDSLVLLAWRLRGVEDAIRIVLRASAAWPFSVAFDFSLRTTDAGKCDSGGNTRRRGGVCFHLDARTVDKMVEWYSGVGRAASA